MPNPNPTPAPWEAIAARKRSARDSLLPAAWLLPASALPSPSSSTPLSVLSIPQTSGLLTPLELSITQDHDATSLLHLLSTKKLSSLAVTTAFCKRATIAQQLTNCLTEPLFVSALARARYLDAYLEKEGRVVGPLHGLPVSVKDTFKIAGYDSSIGIAALCFRPAESNSPLIDILLAAGAVLYCKTNVPQTLQALDSDNNVFGRVLNPANRLATAGGSSGGEGALMAMGGSVLGVGTDVGGSIRVPAMCNGLYGFKPSAGRVPYAGQESGSRPGVSRLGLVASAGPVARSVRDLELFLKVVAAARPWEGDAEGVVGGWEAQGGIGEGEGGGESRRGPVFGVLRWDGIIRPLPPVDAVLEETVQALRKSGIEVVEVEAPRFKEIQSLCNKFFGIDGGKFVFDLLEETGEPLTNWLSTRLRRKAPISLDALIDLQVMRTELQTEMLKMWTHPTKAGRRIDAIICPVAPHPVPPIDRWNSVSYTASWVFLDYPAATVPVRDFGEGDLMGELRGGALNGWDKVNGELWNPETIDRNVYLNTKLSIQVVAPRLQERRLYQALQIIDEILHPKKPQRQSLRL